MAPIVTNDTPTNPSILQPASSDTAAAALPLYLIHDGGGTIYAYHGFRTIDRPVWGISNPRFATGRKFRGGIYEMATIYAELIRQSWNGRAIILGGWSLGGTLAVEISRVLTRQGTVPVAGVVLIDTPCPNPTVKAALPKLRFDEHCPPETRLLVEMSVRESLRMAGSYHPPLYAADWRPGIEASSEDENGASDPPPFILLRATDYMPLDISPDPKTGMDFARELPLLGWEASSPAPAAAGQGLGEVRLSLVKGVLEVHGHHCNLFEDHPEELTAQMNKACDMLEQSFNSAKNKSDSSSLSNPSHKHRARL